MIGGGHLIKICDAIMGSGKSESAIHYMNTNPDKPFVYITPYLDEATRIRDGCPDRIFFEPQDTLKDFSFSKLEHTRYLLKAGVNIATTHAAFRSYTVDMLDAITEHGYTLIVDEAVEVFREAEYNTGDIQVLEEAGYIVKSDEICGYVCTGKEYTGSRLRDLFDMLRCQNLIPVEKPKGGVQYYYWSIPSDVLAAFPETIVLTYLFEAQEFSYFMKMNGFEYKYIGIHYEDGVYSFADEPDYIPPYVGDIASKLHIFYNSKLNSVGKNRNALSSNWLKSHKDEKAVLKKNIYNFVRYYNKSKGADVMWSTFKGSIKSLQGLGYTNGFVPFNKKATNEYMDKTVLAYCVNVFASPQKVKFFRRFGVTYNEDGFALSNMIQWIWRSAIRNGEEVTIYIPSRRMRELLEKWIQEVSA